MNDEPLQFLNLKEEAEPAGSGGGWWIVSLVSLVGVSGLGVLIGLLMRWLELDWDRASVLLPIGGGIVLGVMLGVIFAVVSLVKGEKRSLWAVLVVLPCLLCLVGKVINVYQEVVLVH